MTTPQLPTEKKKFGCLKIMIILGIIGVFCIGGCVLFVGRVAEEVDKGQKAELASANATPVTDIEWDELDEVYNLQSASTELQKNELWKKYKGKKVQWSGTVTSVSETFGILQLQVKMNENTLTSDVIVSLKESSREGALTLQKGDAVKFEGILDNWGSLMPITLKNGIILNQ